MKGNPGKAGQDVTGSHPDMSPSVMDMVMGQRCAGHVHKFFEIVADAFPDNRVCKNPPAGQGDMRFWTLTSRPAKAALLYLRLMLCHFDAGGRDVEYLPFHLLLGSLRCQLCLAVRARGWSGSARSDAKLFCLPFFRPSISLPRSLCAVSQLLLQPFAAEPPIRLSWSPKLSNRLLIFLSLLNWIRISFCLLING